MGIETYSKKELMELIKELKDKLAELKPVEAQLTAVASELPAPALGLHKDEKGNFHLVELKYDFETKAAAVQSVVNLNSKDPSIASYKLKEYVIEKIFRKTIGSKYDK